MKVKTMRDWHNEVCKDRRCAICKRIFPKDMICGHHIKSKGSRPDLKLETDNGIPLCDTPQEINKFMGCHKYAHHNKKVIDNLQ